MFDDEKQPQMNGPKLDNKVAEPKVSTETKGNEDGSLHTMPMEYYLGKDTISATKKTDSGATAKYSPTSNAGGSNKKWLKILIIIVLVALLAMSGYLLFKTYLTPSQDNQTDVLSTDNQADRQAEPEVVTPDTTTEPEVVETDTTIPEKINFNPSVIKRYSISVISSQDTDKDGLTDDEEALLGTSLTAIDTDNDGYKDGEEVQNFYSPLQVGSVTLAQTDFIKKYENLVYGYEFLYPADWVVEALDPANPTDVVVATNLPEFINILVIDKSATQNIDEWYLAQAPSVNITQVKQYQTKQGLNILESPDGFTVYIDKGDKVFVLNYNIGLNDLAHFPNLFTMMVNSFNFFEVKQVQSLYNSDNVSVSLDVPVKEITNCEGEGCFVEKFANCETGSTYIAEVDGLGSYYYEIIGPEAGKCKIKTKYLDNLNTDWIGKEMICLYDNSKDLISAGTEVLNNFTNESNTCSGELYDLFINI